LGKEELMRDEFRGHIPGGKARIAGETDRQADGLVSASAVGDKVLSGGDSDVRVIRDLSVIRAVFRVSTLGVATKASTSET